MLNRDNVLVSIVVPVYNSEEYVAGTVISALKQFPRTDKLEVIAVNDGSTDGSLAVLQGLAEADSRLTVLTQENSGGPSAPRNYALSVACGKYVFFLDADDMFTEKGLEDIVEAAERHNSDVVLARFGSINGRHVPSHMFRKTEPDADLVKSHAWDSLGPVKLFRRELIERLNLRFAEDQWIGEDQVFTASMYLNAEKITILADREYILIRNRDDGGNITSRRQSLNDKYLTASRLGSVIANNVPAGSRRDRLMRRIFTSTLPAAVGHLLQYASDTEVTDFMQKFRSEVIGLYSDGVRDYCIHLLRLKYYFLFHGTVSQLRSISRYTADSLANSYSVAPSGDLVVSLPNDLTEALPASLLSLGTPRFEMKLTGISYQQRSVTYAGSVSITGVNITPIIDQLVLVERKTGEVIPLRWSLLQPTPTRRVGELAFSFSVARDDSVLRKRLHAGAWGIFVQVGVGRTSESVRFGKRPSEIPNHRSTFPAEVGCASITAYFNHGYENLTFDVDSHVHKAEPLIEVLYSQNDPANGNLRTIFRATNASAFDFSKLATADEQITYSRITEEVFGLEIASSNGGESDATIYVKYDKVVYGFGI